MSPSPTLLPCPAGQPPLNSPGQHELRFRERYQPFGGCPPVSAQQCGFGRGVASGAQVSVALAALRPAAPTGSVAAAGGSCCRPAVQSSAKSRLLRCCAPKRGRGGAGSSDLTMPLDRHHGPPPRRWPAGLSIGDRISLDRANVDISADLGGAIVEDSFEVKTTAHPIVYIDQDRTRRCQVIVAQKIDIPAIGASVADVNLDDGHPRVVGEFDPPIRCRGWRPGRGLQGANNRPRDNRGP